MAIIYKKFWNQLILMSCLSPSLKYNFKKIVFEAHILGYRIFYVGTYLPIISGPWVRETWLWIPQTHTHNIYNIHTSNSSESVAWVFLTVFSISFVHKITRRWIELRVVWSAVGLDMVELWILLCWFSFLCPRHYL